MDETNLAHILGPALSGALERKGYTRLTAVQRSVLDPALSERDLRITSQTGSGKTVAVGFALRALVTASDSKGHVARPRALVVAPTRELARQFEEELSWLYADLGARVASTTGGASFRDERRALAAGPAVIVGTPGRLLDHLTRGSIDTSAVGAVVLDEADRLLDLGFREDLEAILAYAPAGHRTHLVSATFPRDVRALADKVQPGAAHVEGTRLGAANVDIDHVVYLVDSHDRTAAIVNLLLVSPDTQTLAFARTRADVARIARDLGQAGFRVSSLSGEMEQPARNRALAAFKRGELQVLVATDVAARGLDVQDIARVLHVDPPNDADTYTHRSGRTGRAGRKGTSAVLVAPGALRRTAQLLLRAGVSHRIEPVPAADAIRAASDARFFAELTAAEAEGSPGFDARTWSLADRLAKSGDATRTIARLLTRAKYAGPAEARDLRPIAPPAEPRAARAVHAAPNDRWVTFRVSWGDAHGADPRRLLAVVCRRGGIEGRQVGAIRIDRTWSTVDVATDVADAFAEAAGQPDPRSPRVLISRAQMQQRHNPAWGSKPLKRRHSR